MGSSRDLGVRDDGLSGDEDMPAPTEALDLSVDVADEDLSVSDSGVDGVSSECARSDNDLRDIRFGFVAIDKDG